MTEVGGSDDPEQFFPSGRDAASGQEVVGTNVCRATVLGAMFQESRASLLIGTENALAALGFERTTVEILGRNGLHREAISRDWFAGIGAEIASPEVREQAWISINEQSDDPSAMTFLIGMLGSSSERESAAAAAVLYRMLAEFESPGRWTANDLLASVGAPAPFIEPIWEPDFWQRIFRSIVPDGRTRGPEERLGPIRALVILRLRLARNSPDPIARSFALAIGLAEAPSQSDAALPESAPREPAARIHSTLVHGTFAWRGDWWRPSGGFHKYVLRDLRPDLYAKGARYSWSGALSQRQRIIACGDLLDWANEISPGGLRTLFGHSYGGEISAMAAGAGLSIDELVLLSTPATAFVNAAVGSVKRVIDVRLPWDPVLAIAGTPQGLISRHNVTPIKIQWTLDHSATHDARTWRRQNVAARASL